MTTVDFTTRARRGTDQSSIKVEIECPHSSVHRTPRCCVGDSTSYVPRPGGKPADQWTLEDLSRFLAGVVSVASSGFRPNAPVPLTFEQLWFNATTRKYLTGRSAKRQVALMVGGHRVAFWLDGYPHRAFAELLAQNSDRNITITVDVARRSTHSRDQCDHLGGRIPVIGHVEKRSVYVEDSEDDRDDE